MEEVVNKTAAEKSAEMREKYADIINDIAVRQAKDVGVAFEMLKAIPRAILNGEEPLYTTELELNMPELIMDYAELVALSLEK